MTQKMPTKEELVAAGIPESAIVDRSNHPSIQASTWDVPASDKQVTGAKSEYHMPHIRPQSVLVAGIGNLWDEGAWWRLQDMLLHTALAGHSVSLQEMHDASIFSFEAIPMMRWSASMMARDGGMEWLLMVDNDVLLEKDTLLRLLAHDRPVVFPFLEDLEKRLPRLIAPLSGPDLLESGHGLVPVRWAAMSCMLFNVKIFNVLSETAWRGSDYLFAQCLNYLGHRVYVDTDTVVKITRGPTRHASKEYDEYWADHRKMWDRLRFEDRDRRPPPDFNPLKDNGYVDKYGTYFGMLNSVARGTDRQQNGNANPQQHDSVQLNRQQRRELGRKLWTPNPR